MQPGGRDLVARAVQAQGGADALAGVKSFWSPGPPLPDKLNPALASLVAAVRKAGITPAKFAGGHGGVGDYAPLAALEGK